MEEIVYHASKTANLTELDPNESKHELNHGRKFLYATQSKELAMIFSMRTTDLYTVVSGKGTEEDPAIFVERLPGVFDKFLHNPTTIYGLSGKDFYRGTTYDGEVVTEKKQQVLSEEYIEDVYSKIKEMATTGNLRLYYYPDRPPEIPLDNSDLIESRMLPSYRAAQSAKERLDIVRKTVKVHPKLFPKIMKSIISENIATIKNKFQTTNKALPPAKTAVIEETAEIGTIANSKAKPSWDLENWGIDPAEFRRETPGVVRRSLIAYQKSLQHDTPTQEENYK